MQKFIEKVNEYAIEQLGVSVREYDGSVVSSKRLVSKCEKWANYRDSSFCTVKLRLPNGSIVKWNRREECVKRTLNGDS